MNKVIGVMLERKAELEENIASAKKRLKKAPDGAIAVTTHKGIPQYYYNNKNDGVYHQYMRADQKKLAHEIIQAEYDRSILCACQKELKEINRYIKNHCEYELEDKYDKLCETRKRIVTPLIQSDQDYINSWLSRSFEPNDFYEDDCLYETKNGELVRSKSEALIADMYYSLGVPYIYECPIYLDYSVKKYPDFTILDVKNRKEIYHEHLGLMDDEEYRLKNLKKINEYRHNGIYSGKNLIVTYEAAGCPINIRDLEKMVIEMLGL